VLSVRRCVRAGVIISMLARLMAKIWRTDMYERGRPCDVIMACERRSIGVFEIDDCAGEISKYEGRRKAAVWAERKPVSLENMKNQTVNLRRFSACQLAIQRSWAVCTTYQPTAYAAKGRAGKARNKDSQYNNSCRRRALNEEEWQRAGKHAFNMAMTANEGGGGQWLGGCHSW